MCISFSKILEKALKIEIWRQLFKLSTGSDL